MNQNYILMEVSVGGLINKIAEKPRVRLGINLFLTVSIGVMSSILASQIMPNGILTWGLVTHVISFWILLPLSCFWFWIQCEFLNYDEDVTKFADDAYCKAHMRKSQLQGIAQVIKSDPVQSHLIDTKEFFKKMGIK